MQLLYKGKVDENDSNFDSTNKSPKNIIQKSKNKKVAHCKFCEEDVHSKNFVRHLERSHQSETELINIFQLPKSSKERRIALSALRYDTNFNLYINSNKIRPVRKQSTANGEPTYYPCGYCKGLFVKSYLKRHSKKCLFQKQWTKANKTRQNHMTNSQTIVACALDPTKVISKFNVKEQTLHENNEQNINERVVIQVKHKNTFTEVQAPDHTNSFPSSTCSDKENENHSYSLRSYVSKSVSTKIDNDDKAFKIDSQSEFSSTNTDNSEIIDNVRPILINNKDLNSATPVKLFSKEIKIQRSKNKKVAHCKFCEEDVYSKNFVRHLERSHQSETELINIFQLPKSSKERRIALSAFRYDTNFDLYINSIKIRPVRKQSTADGEPTYYPCAYCKGLFVKSYLKRHAKSCLFQKQWTKGNETRQNHMANSQTIVACALDPTNVISKLNVKEQVFKIMKSDEISFEAKKDLLISNLGESYLKKHRRKRMMYGCSNLMRELSRLLISYRKLTNTDVPFKDLLHPRNFDNVVAAVRIIVGYDHVTKTFKSPSLAVHLGTSLKLACDELTQLILKESSGFKCNSSDESRQWLHNIKNFKILIEARWNSELAFPQHRDSDKSDTIDETLDKKQRIKKQSWSNKEVKLVETHFQEFINENGYPSNREIREFIAASKIKRTVPVIKSKIQHLIKKNNRN
ncbi:uncharacterized protein LOC126886500 isoform X2 [Diabrotica virgifera virgifera]|uniref:Uncharacterized protein n=1 Tax=Diabrotica virgifera virgifera TaxID=50390 RepID=A0ABM5KGT9_DIAVI|nr:uncharacterized protein LOC126886500 isoform X2 [Diabrotica virgifera virgifera]